MKISTAAIIAALTANSANAFVAPTPRASGLASTRLFADTLEKASTDTAEIAKKFQEKLDADEKKVEEPVVAVEVEAPVVAAVEEPVAPAPIVEKDPTLDPKNRVQVGRYNDIDRSLAMPFLKRPTKLDGTHAGDVGFDPLGFSEDYDMYTMMEAEIRHARLAMLAVVGWPMSELNAPNWMLHGPNHLAPSVLNGFDPLSFIAVAGIFGAFGYFEYKTSLRKVDDTELGKKHTEDMANVWKYGVPGDYNFDPLNLYSMFGDTADARKAMRELEITHGRWAMVGITAFAAWEALTGHQIVENSMFFHPNLLLPSLVASYVAFSAFYEVKNTDQYLFRVEMSSEGEARMNNLQRRTANLSKDALEYSKVAFEYAKVATETTIETSKDIKEKYDSINDNYTNYALRNVRKD
uniref:Plastid light harvesting protein n=2 Tax=Leptocylindrus danicus TaxID=163516 RepID=A0A7S2K8T8_9STRA|mmetsp:Transcript_19905/g.29603  ORF Transcript_19905/g.29603 Transcript_19905/m.29603 type:complete len:408 (+) Transcript_19905:146-1369(+)